MIISLKCGGVGLNLTRANKVINMDLAWCVIGRLARLCRSSTC